MDTKKKLRMQLEALKEREQERLLVHNHLLEQEQARKELDSPKLDRQMFKMRYTKHCMQQWISMYFWIGLPFGMSSNKIMYELYTRGWLLGYMNDEGIPLITPAIPENVNYLGLPTSFRPIDFVGNHTTIEPRIPDVDCFVLNAMAPLTPYGLCEPISGLNAVFVEQIAECFARLQINMVNSNLKFILNAGDTNNITVYEEQLQEILSADKPYAVVGKDLGTEITDIGNTNPHFQEYIFLIRNLDSMRSEQIGEVANIAGEMKSQYQNNTEVGQTQLPMMTMYADNYRRFAIFAENMNKTFGTQILVQGGI